jgi:predicted dehydrogenase
MDLSELKCGFVGCGLATFERAKALPTNTVVACLDGYDRVEKQFCSLYGAKSVPFEEMLEICNVIFVCTPHEFLYDYAKKSLEKGIHTLIEKPGAITGEELKELQEISIENKKVCHIGYTIGNILKSNGEIPENPKSILANYCHGARPGYDKEWRMKSAQRGGGVRYDLLTHITHMALLCDSNFEFINGVTSNSYWDSEGDDTAAIMLKNPKTKSIANLFASCADWKKNFNFSINYSDYKIIFRDVNARNGEYSLVKYLNTGPGIMPTEVSENKNGNFWVADTLLFIEKIKRNIPTDLFVEIKTLEIIESLNN